MNIYTKIGLDFHTLFFDKYNRRKDRLFSAYNVDKKEWIPYDDEDTLIFDKVFLNSIEPLSDEELGQYIVSRLKAYLEMNEDLMKGVSYSKSNYGFAELQEKITKLDDSMKMMFQNDFDKRDDMYRDFDIYLSKMFFVIDKKSRKFMIELMNVLYDIDNQWMLVKNLYYTLKGLNDMKFYLQEIKDGIVYRNKNEQRIDTDAIYAYMTHELYLVSEMYDFYVGRFIYNHFTLKQQIIQTTAYTSVSSLIPKEMDTRKRSTKSLGIHKSSRILGTLRRSMKNLPRITTKSNIRTHPNSRNESVIHYPKISIPSAAGGSRRSYRKRSRRRSRRSKKSARRKY